MKFLNRLKKKVDIKFPIKNVDDFVALFDKACRDIIENKKWRLRLAVIDHISSQTGILYPIDKISNHF